MITILIVLGALYVFVAFILMIIAASSYEYTVEDWGPWGLMACALWLPLLVILSVWLACKYLFDKWVGQ